MTDSVPSDPSETGPVVCPNISPRERRKRLYAGIAAFAAAAVFFAILIAFGADRWWRLLLIVPLWGGASGFFQWRDKT
jgi:hypothetical protein